MNFSACPTAEILRQKSLKYAHIPADFFLVFRQPFGAQKLQKLVGEAIQTLLVLFPLIKNDSPFHLLLCIRERFYFNIFLKERQLFLVDPNKNPCNFLFYVVKYKSIVDLPVAQWIMRWTPTPKTAGSTPAGQARKFWREERLAPQFSSNPEFFAQQKIQCWTRTAPTLRCGEWHRLFGVGAFIAQFFRELLIAGSFLRASA